MSLLVNREQGGEQSHDGRPLKDELEDEAKQIDEHFPHLRAPDSAHHLLARLFAFFSLDTLLLIFSSLSFLGVGKSLVFHLFKLQLIHRRLTGVFIFFTIASARQATTGAATATTVCSSRFSFQ